MDSVWAGLYRLGMVQLIQKYKTKQISPLDYIQRVIHRHSKVKDLGYFTYFDYDDILFQAEKASYNYNNNIARPLEGVPIAFKDNIDVQYTHTTACTPALYKFLPKNSSQIAQILIDNGAIFAGKCNMHELAYGVTSINNYSTNQRNFYNINFSAGGSSGGCGGAVSADVVPVSIGTDTGGSIRIPAASGGVWGYKPTIGRWPAMYGLKSTHLRDTVGPLVRRAEDLEMLDSIFVGGEETSQDTPRIGVPRKHF